MSRNARPHPPPRGRYCGTGPGPLPQEKEVRGSDAPVHLITLDPGHFHAGLVQKLMYPEVSPIVHIYAPAGPDLEEHLKRIEGFNTRTVKPTHWEQRVYAGPDFLERMERDKPGNVVIISGNNARKTEYIFRSVRAGLNVLADKPMAITSADFELLNRAFRLAAENQVLLYDIMTERYEVASILQRELARAPEVFGLLAQGTPEEPAVVMESVHHLYKEVAGRPLTRPVWFFDVCQQGEAITDVGTHLVDLVQWEACPEQPIDWTRDIQVLDARRWATTLTPQQFQRVTSASAYPDYLTDLIGPEGTLSVFANGNVSYTLRGVHAKVTARWSFEAPPGAGDTHYSLLRGSRANFTIRQGPEQGWQPTLYVEPASSVSGGFEQALRAALVKLSAALPGVEANLVRDGWEIVVPEAHRIGHEAHFAQVTGNYLRFLATGRMPQWEVANMLAKYWVTTQAHRLSHCRLAV